MQKKCILVLAQTLNQVQLTVVRLMNLPLTAFVERLVAGARGRLPPPLEIKLPLCKLKCYLVKGRDYRVYTRTSYAS